MPSSIANQRRATVLQIERYVDDMTLMGRSPTKYEGANLMKSLALLSAGEVEEARATFREVQEGVRGSASRPSGKVTLGQIHQRLQAVKQDIGI